MNRTNYSSGTTAYIRYTESNFFTNIFVKYTKEIAIIANNTFFY